MSKEGAHGHYPDGKSFTTVNDFRGIFYEPTSGARTFLKDGLESAVGADGSKAKRNEHRLRSECRQQNRLGLLARMHSKFEPFDVCIEFSRTMNYAANYFFVVNLGEPKHTTFS
jgi:hypothetical protein